MPTMSELLKSSNLKVTPQRLAIFGFLLNTTSHPSAEIIYNHLKSDYPSMSLATIYKTLASLKEAKLIQELNVGEDSYRYDANTDFHPHLVCSDCNEVYDYFSHDLLKDVKAKIEDATGFDIQGEQVYFYGICKNCKN